jgi:hypothetical protein
VQIVLKILAQKTLHKNRAGGVSQGEGPEFKPQYHKKKKKKKVWKKRERKVFAYRGRHIHLAGIGACF